MKKIFIFMILLWCIATAAALAAKDTRPEYRQEAINNVSAAGKLMTQAQDMTSSKMTQETITSAIGLYAQAGQLLERAETIFKALGTQYVSEADMDQCTKVKEYCVRCIDNLKKELARLSTEESK